jgi:hypothetical protein
MQPYIYKLRNKLTGQYYIGVQYGKKSNPSNLWKTYFSSSKYVLENKENFEVVYTKPREDAREYESKLLNRIFRIFGKEKFLQIMFNRNPRNITR